MKLSVCIESVFRGMDACEAMAKVSAAGYDTFEFWGWKNKDIDAVADAKKRLGLNLSVFSASSASLVVKEKRAEFIDGITESIAVAKRFGCDKLITTAGMDTGEPREAQRESLIAGLKAAAPALADAGVTLLLEPLNAKRDHKGVYLVYSDEAFEVLKAVDSPYVKCLFDIYHQQISEGDVLTTIKNNLPYIGHFHSAGNPGRHELYDGELNYCNIIRAITDMGYDGCFGLEYFPVDPVEKGLADALSMLKG